MDRTGNKNVDELRGKPVCKLFSRGKFRKWERVLFEAPQGKDAKGGGFSDEPASKKAGDILRR